MKKYLLVLGLSFVCACVQAESLKQLKAEEKALRAQVKALEEPKQIEKTKANIIRLRDKLLTLQKEVK